MEVWYFGVLAVAVLGWLVWYYRRDDRRRARMMQGRLSEEEETYFQQVALVQWLPDELRTELAAVTLVLLREKNFEGPGGLALTPKRKVTVAALAGLLLLNKPGHCDFYPGLRNILLYADAYIAPERRYAGNGAVIVGSSARLGESWGAGDVVLAWRSVQDEAFDPHAAHNVVLHEFAHQLDLLDGLADGSPPMRDGRAWRAVMRREYDRLCDEKEHAVREVIDWYGATNPAEFFAVVTESFFCKPHHLRAAHPDLYRQFAGFYRMDPAAWRENRLFKS